MAAKTCPEYGTPIPHREGRGRPRIYCCDRCLWRAEQRAWRNAHPLGWRMFRDLGIVDHGLLAMLRRSGVPDA